MFLDHCSIYILQGDSVRSRYIGGVWHTGSTATEQGIHIP